MFRYLLTFSSFLILLSCTTDGQDIEIYEPQAPPTPTFTLSVTPGTGGTVSTSGGNYDEGTSVTITATPNNGYAFTGWSGNATGTNTSLTVTINGNTSVTANFEILTYTLTVNSDTGGSVSGGGAFNFGTQVTLSASPISGYSFSSWSDGSTEQSRTITVSENLTLTANFIENINNYTLSFEAEDGGTVSSIGGVYEEGSDITISATPDNGFLFSSWSDGSTEQSRTITVSENLTLTANFEIITYTLTGNAGTGGTVTPNLGTYDFGTQVTLSATPNNGYTFSSWSDGSTEQERTITVSSNLTLTANFEIISYTLSVNAGSGGYISSNGGTYNYGAQVTLSATPNSGYSFSSWSDGSTEQNRTITVSQNLTLTANFNQNTTTTTTETETSSTGTTTGGGGSTSGSTSSGGGSTSGSTSSGGGSTSGSTSTGSNLCGGSPNGVSSSGAITCTFTISVTSGGGGTTSPSPGTYTYNKDNLVNFTATPDEGYQFVRWTGSISSMSSSGTATMTTNHSITAIFELIPAIYLDSNGVTVKALAGKSIGYQETLNGDVYTIVDRETLISKVGAGENVSYLVTSYITNMLNIFNPSSTPTPSASPSASFNQDISSWDVSNVINFDGMFKGATSFNQDISSWDVSKAEDMAYMFMGASSFNQPLGSWDVSSLGNSRQMFKNATSFNQDISSWNISNVYNMSEMFMGASSYNQDLSAWNLSGVTNCASFYNSTDSWEASKKPNTLPCGG
jgi:uncharacterized repeat protein (TIGR02543 family)